MAYAEWVRSRDVQIAWSRLQPVPAQWGGRRRPLCTSDLAPSESEPRRSWPAACGRRTISLEDATNTLLLTGGGLGARWGLEPGIPPRRSIGLLPAPLRASGNLFKNFCGAGISVAELRFTSWAFECAQMAAQTCRCPQGDLRGGRMNFDTCNLTGQLQRTLACVSAMAVAALMLFAAPAAARDGQEQEGGGPLRAGNGPGPAANGPGPGCNVIPPLASVGTRVNISQFPPPDSLTDPELAGPVQLLRSGKFDIPIESLTGADVPSGTPRGTVTLPLFKGAVKTPSGLKPAWYIVLDAGDQPEAHRLGVNFPQKLRNAGDAARKATLRADGTFLFESGSVDFSPNRVVVPGADDRPFPPREAQPGSVGDADYSPLVDAGGIIYDAPIIAAAVEDAVINFPNGHPNYALVHDQVIAIDPAQRAVTLSFINGFC